ncbi:MAG: replicative DNA helicase [Oscillospiraceae bacterium]|nr:replicative DNA helicase [Oscillospiraceae bacterium]
MEFIERTLPWSAEAEVAVLGSMFMDNNVISDVAPRLAGDDFYMPRNNELYEAMIDLYNLGTPIEMVTLVEHLKLRGSFDRIGGLEYVAEVMSATVTSANVKYYTKIIEEKSTLRKLIKACGEIEAEAFGGESEVEEIVSNAEQAIFNIIENRNTRDFEHIKSLLEQSLEKIEELSEKSEQVTGVYTGFADLDRMTAGFQPSDLILIAARPSMGKTSFALNIAQNAAVMRNTPVAVFSLEMSGVQLATRMLSAQAMISSTKIRNGDLRDNDWVEVTRAMEPLCNAPIYIDDSSGITVTEIAAKCRRLKLEKGLGMIVIDYLQLMRGSRRSENRQTEVAEISRSLKILAKELDVPVVTLSQLSRGPESRADHRPMLSDLRESGAIEQDADVVMFLYRDDYYNEETEERNVAECILAKHRNGEVGKVKLAWLAEYTKFSNYTGGHRDGEW